MDFSFTPLTPVAEGREQRLARARTPRGLFANLAESSRERSEKVCFTCVTVKSGASIFRRVRVGGVFYTANIGVRLWEFDNSFGRGGRENKKTRLSPTFSNLRGSRQQPCEALTPTPAQCYWPCFHTPGPFQWAFCFLSRLEGKFLNCAT